MITKILFVTFSISALRELIRSNARSRPGLFKKTIKITKKKKNYFIFFLKNETNEIRDKVDPCMWA
jgi:hypothetical protein